jgi:hypothetical protein
MILYRSGKLEEAFPKKRFHQQFDHAFLSTHAVHHLGHEGARNVLKKDALVTVESPRYLFQLDKEQKQEFVKRTHALATTTSKLESLGPTTCQNICGLLHSNNTKILTLTLTLTPTPVLLFCAVLLPPAGLWLNDESVQRCTYQYVESHDILAKQYTCNFLYRPNRYKNRA